MRALACFFFCAACGGTLDGLPLLVDGGALPDGALTDGAPTDGNTVKDAVPDAPLPPFDAGAFCSGSSPRMMINGAEVTVLKASGKTLALNCCDSAELTLATSAYQALFNVLWRAQVPASSPINVSSPPQGFGIELDLGCDPAITSCATSSPEERYAQGFGGSIQYQYGMSGMNVSYCLTAAESPSSPHMLIHSLAIYAPNVASP